MVFSPKPVYVHLVSFLPIYKMYNYSWMQWRNQKNNQGGKKFVKKYMKNKQNLTGRNYNFYFENEISVLN